MKDFAALTVLAWIGWGLGVVARPEYFAGLTGWVVLGSILLLVYGLLYEAGRTAHELRMRDSNYKFQLEQIEKNTAYQIALEAAAAQREKVFRETQVGNPNSSYYLHGLGK